MSERPSEATGPMLIDGHQFGHHPDDRDPWDALYLDIKWLDGASDNGSILALVTFWKGEAKKAAAAERERWDEAVKWAFTGDGTKTIKAVLAARAALGQPVPEEGQLRQAGRDVTPQGGSYADGSAAHGEQEDSVDFTGSAEAAVAARDEDLR